MNLSEPFIRRPVMTILLMVSFLFFGITAYNTLPVSDLPNVDMPTIRVSVDYPGASPKTMANAVTTPLEQQFMTIEGIESIFSTSITGSTTIILTFELDRDVDAASTDVQAAISRAQPNLPSNLPNQPTYERVNPAANPILYLALTSQNMTLSQLYDYGNTFVGQRISMVDGVAQVETYGSPYAVRVRVDPEKLAAKNIGLDEVSQKIQTTNVDLPVGTLYGNREDYTISVDGQIIEAKGYNQLIIKNENGDLVKVQDIGEALDSVQYDKFFQHYVTKKGSDPCIILAIQRLPGKNSVKIIRNIEKMLQTLKDQLPNSFKIEEVYSQAHTIVRGVKDVELGLFFSFLLVVSVIYLFLGKAMNTLIPSLALPISVFGTFAALFLLGYSLDLLSLLAITLCMGFLVDDAIVVLENNVRHVQLGQAPFEATLKGSKEISTTVLSMTLCLVAAFIPMAFMGGVVGKLFREFAMTIIVSVLISGVVSLTLIPMLSARLVKPYTEEKKTRIERFADRINERLKKIYEPCLHWALNHRLLMLFLGLSSIAASLFLAYSMPKDLLPPDDIGFIKGHTVARDGTSPFLMNKYHEEIDQICIQDSNVESIISVSSYSNSNEGVMFFRLKPYSERKSMKEAIRDLSDKLKDLPGVNTFLSPLPIITFQIGTTAQALYQYSLTSIHREKLYDYSEKLLAQMKNDPTFSQVSSDLRIHQPQWAIHILREKASNYNVSAAAIENYFQRAYSNNKITQINGEINQYSVLIETFPEFYKDPSVLSKLYISSSTGAQVPLSELVEVKEIVGPLTINHIDGLPAVGISFDLGDGVSLGEALQKIEEYTQKDMPDDISGKVIGTADIFKSSYASLGFLIMLAFFVIYVILGVLYESFIHPITVMSALPPALLGGLLSLRLFGASLTLYSFVGLILLIGIVLKNGIMMVDFAIEAVEKEKKSAYDAVIEASLIRFRPILMTTFCALMGAVPIAIGVGAMTETRALGICIVGGLLISQVLTLLLTPVLYYYFELLQEKIQKRFGSMPKD